jgi:hypothetical protein
MIPTLMGFQTTERREWLRKVSAALHLLENGCNMYPHEIAPLIYENMDQMGPAQMEIMGLVDEIWSNEESKEPDKRFRPILNLYIVLYEKCYPLLVAPLVAADAMLRTRVPIAQLIHENGRARYSAIEDLEEGRNYPQGLLTDGLNRHIRNSISHHHYAVRSLEEIVMDDRDPRSGQLTWGPVTYNYYDLRNLVLNFSTTCDALISALIMFDVNNHDVLRERGFIDLKPVKLRFDLAQTHMRFYADNYGFQLVEMDEIDSRRLQIVIKIMGWREQGPSKILVGGTGWARQYVEDVRTEDCDIRGQVYGLLQHTLDVHDCYECVTLNVLRPDDTVAGIIKADRAIRQRIFEGKMKIGDLRSLLSEDTIADETMPVVFRSLPKDA